MIIDTEVSGNSHVISDLYEGVYLVKIKTSNNEIVKRILKF